MIHRAVSRSSASSRSMASCGRSSASGPAAEPGAITRSRGAAATRSPASPRRRAAVGQHVGEAGARRQADHVRDHGFLQVGADQRDVRLVAGQGDGEVGRHQAGAVAERAPVTRIDVAAGPQRAGEHVRQLGEVPADRRPGDGDRQLERGPLQRQAHQHRHVELGRDRAACGSAGPCGPARKARIRPISRPTSNPLGKMSSGFGLDALDGGMALLMIDPPDGLASSAVSCATWLFSELSWLWSEFSCSSAAARCGELSGRLADLDGQLRRGRLQAADPGLQGRDLALGGGGRARAGVGQVRLRE